MDIFLTVLCEEPDTVDGLLTDVREKPGIGDCRMTKGLAAIGQNGPSLKDVHGCIGEWPGLHGFRGRPAPREALPPFRRSIAAGSPALNLSRSVAHGVALPRESQRASHSWAVKCLR